jgi:hypothetical protein
MKQITVLAIAVLAMFGSLSEGHASTKLLWRTAAIGATIVTNSQGKLVPLGQPIDVSAYDRIRVVVVARRPSGLAQNSGFGSPFHIELHIGEVNDDLGLLENGAFSLNPTSMATDVAAHTERATGVFDFPVITTLLVDAVGPTTSGPPTTVDIYVYGETSSGTSG